VSAILRKSAKSSEILDAIKRVVGEEPANLHEPDFGGNELNYLKDCIDSTFVSSSGKYVDKFEAELANFVNTKFVISVVNGTAALHLSLILSGVKPGDEVLVPALSFVATANAVAYCGATPHFVDSNFSTLGMDTDKLRQHLIAETKMIDGFCVNKKTQKIIRAVVPMHTFGHPVDIDGVLAIANDFNLQLIEDSAESLGSFYKNKHTGTFGRFGVLSFNGNKTITTGGGGAILTDNEEDAVKAKHLSTTARLKHNWEFKHDQIGFNYRMPNLNAALGCAQMEKLPEKLQSKKLLFHRYSEAFSGIEGVSIFAEPRGSSSNYWLQTLMLSEDNLELRDEILEKTNAQKIMTRPIWTPLSELSPYISSPSMNLDVVKSLGKRLISLPSSPGLGLVKNV
jgi:aminotransferase in exopolysaccharide biosynthesis